ncbi:MAG: hypothetical protein QOE68_859 [Thermoanaerobaculia bacterium]|jgi:hypothetical protein|nr:hypothetical protein [Thermoanaerobaculia bacterium]
MPVFHAKPVAEEDSSAQPTPAPPGQLRYFVRNIVCLTLTGVAISFWLVQYTDFFPLVGGLLGLTGIFAWVAFLTNLISAERKKELQAEIERRVLVIPTTATWALLVLVGFGIFAATQSTVMVVAPLDGIKRTVDIRAEGRVIETLSLDPGGTVKTSLRVRPGQSVVVKTAGCPEVRVALTSFHRTTLLVPQSFTAQSVLLARLSDDIATSARHSKVAVKIKRAGRNDWKAYGTIKEDLYEGESVWIGCSSDVAIPDRIKAEWKEEAGNNLALLKLWLKVKSVGADDPPEPGDTINVCVTNQQGGPMASATVVVRSIKDEPFPQVVVLSTKGAKCES